MLFIFPKDSRAWGISVGGHINGMPSCSVKHRMRLLHDILRQVKVDKNAESCEVLTVIHDVIQDVPAKDAHNSI